MSPVVGGSDTTLLSFGEAELVDEAFVLAPDLADFDVEVEVDGRSSISCRSLRAPEFSASQRPPDDLRGPAERDPPPGRLGANEPP